MHALPCAEPKGGVEVPALSDAVGLSNHLPKLLLHARAVLLLAPAFNDAEAGSQPSERQYKLARLHHTALYRPVAHLPGHFRQPVGCQLLLPTSPVARGRVNAPVQQMKHPVRTRPQGAIVRHDDQRLA